MGQTQFVALLRAINVGGRVVRMAELKEIFERAGLIDVSTFIASGNVIFSARQPASRLEATVERALARALGYAVTTMIRTTEEIAAIAAGEIFAADRAAGAAAGSVYIGFMKHAPAAAAVRRALAMQTATDRLQVRGREIYWLARRNMAEASVSGAGLEKALGTPVTFRNLNTIRRLAAKYAAR